MKKSDQLWSDLNTLLGQLRWFGVDKLVAEYFSRHENTAPAELLRMQIDKLQKHLDESQPLRVVFPLGRPYRLPEPIPPPPPRIRG